MYTEVKKKSNRLASTKRYILLVVNYLSFPGSYKLSVGYIQIKFKMSTKREKKNS